MLLQPMNREKSATPGKCKDSFLIQSTLITSDKENSTLQRSITDGGARPRIRQQILEVLYLPPEGQTVEVEDESPAKESSLTHKCSVSLPSDTFVSLNPSNAIGFNRPLTALVKRTLTITNDNAQPAAFKLKTTSPELYRVRPNLGRIEPGKSIDVSVILRPMKEEPPPSAVCKDKFLIQSTLISAEQESISLRDIWSVSREDEFAGSRVHHQKLRVTHLPSYSL